jgi:hypothetical protein
MLRTLLLEAFSYAARRGLGYRDFFLALAATRGAPVSADTRLASMLRDLTQLATSAPANWHIPEGAVLVDGLGLAEGYSIYTSGTFIVDVSINPRGDTLGFKPHSNSSTISLKTSLVYSAISSTRMSLRYLGIQTK